MMEPFYIIAIILIILLEFLSPNTPPPLFAYFYLYEQVCLTDHFRTIKMVPS